MIKVDLFKYSSNIFNNLTLKHNSMDQLLKQKKEIQNDIHYKTLEISKLNKLLDEINKQIYNSCTHEWIPDRSYCGHDRTTYVCSKCSLLN